MSFREVRSPEAPKMTITQGSGLGVAMMCVHDDEPGWGVKRGDKPFQTAWKLGLSVSCKNNFRQMDEYSVVAIVISLMPLSAEPFMEVRADNQVDLIRQYLAERTIGCPVCCYNLRGA